MEITPTSLKPTQFPSTNPASSRYFIFSKQLDRAQLASGFAQTAPSQIVTALNVTKIAPALFYMIEKIAFALEAVLNRAASLLGCAVSVEIIAVDNFGKENETPAAVIEEKQPAPTLAKDQTMDLEELCTGQKINSCRATSWF